MISGCAQRPSNLPQGFQQFTDSDGRFAMVYPDTWTFQPKPGSALTLSDPADASYQLTLARGPVPRADITSITQFNRTEFGKQISKTLIPRSGVDDPSLPKVVVEQRGEGQRTDKKNRVYYDYEFVIAQQGNARHVKMVAVIDQGQLYTLIVGCDDSTWAARQVKVQTMVESFTLLPAQ